MEIELKRRAVWWRNLITLWGNYWIFESRRDFSIDSHVLQCLVCLHLIVPESKILKKRVTHQLSTAVFTSKASMKSPHDNQSTQVFDIDTDATRHMLGLCWAAKWKQNIHTESVITENDLNQQWRMKTICRSKIIWMGVNWCRGVKVGSRRNDENAEISSIIDIINK